MAKRTVKVVKSSKGEFVLPTITVNDREKNLTCFPDRWTLLPKEYADDEYVLDAIEKGLILVRDSDRIPENPKPFPEPIESDMLARNWLHTLLTGEYTDQFKSYLADWRSSRGYGTDGVAIGPGRIAELKQRILPLVQCAIERERAGQNRTDLLADLERMETYILKEEWQNVQSAGRGNTRP